MLRLEVRCACMPCVFIKKEAGNSYPFPASFDRRYILFSRRGKRFRAQSIAKRAHAHPAHAHIHHHVFRNGCVTHLNAPPFRIRYRFRIYGNYINRHWLCQAFLRMIEKFFAGFVRKRENIGRLQAQKNITKPHFSHALSH